MDINFWTAIALINGVFAIIRLVDSLDDPLASMFVSDPKVSSDIKLGFVEDASGFVIHGLASASLFGYLSVSYALPWVALFSLLVLGVWLARERQSGGIFLAIGLMVSVTPAIALFVLDSQGVF